MLIGPAPLGPLACLFDDPRQHLGVARVVLEQLQVASRRDDVAVVDQHHAVCQADRCKPVSDEKRCPAHHEPQQRGVDPLLDLDVDRTRGVVEHEHRWVDEQRPGDRQALALPARQCVAALTDDRGVAVWEPHDELVRVGGLGGFDDLLDRRRRLSVGDVVPDRDREKERLVEDEPHLGAQALQGVLAHVPPIDQ